MALDNWSSRVACLGCLVVHVRAATASKSEDALQEGAEGSDASYDHADAVFGIAPKDHIGDAVYVVC